ncbi:pyrroline-5-carboxylate reductase [Weissella oryzae SG25]|uniref:Pyrroline-5-carboxylate reductase n=1 Tax=Weissella oryzae (strain DSM 25784 / JCM 18191 / LMG 30913 / SG25) TaxID=1329250 RepID=A0A069CTB6_WEIOS|nr:pyrroline-5-carboxylate reductase [Weissella oryzae]GAK31055.1 pyrroline-5-carboxylate reductase [Weissella oryzae SG25]
MKFGFIGFGNMATAIIKGAIKSNKLAANDIFVYSKDKEKTKTDATNLSIRACDTLTELVDNVDYIVLSVKPQVMPSILKEIRELIKNKNKVLVSIAAGLTLDALKQGLEFNDIDQAIVRVMPNLNVSIGEGSSAVAGNDYATDEQVEYVRNIFGAIGKAWILDEKHFSIFTAMAGSMPAYVFLFIDAIARAGVKYGLPKSLADEIAIQSVLGSSSLLQQSGDSAWTMVDKVSSPGGTTVAGVLKLLDNGLQSKIIEGIEATVLKDQELNSK